MPLRDLRRNQRYDLRLPFELIRSGSQSLVHSGQTCNLSSSGVLFTSQATVEIGQPIEFVITLPTVSEGNAVRLRCVGKVVRLDKTRKDPSVAATLERFEFVRGAAG